MDFSIIIPVCHGGEFLNHALESLCRLDYPPDRYELILAGRSDDHESESQVGRFQSRLGAAVTYLTCQKANMGARLNAACRIARGDILVFADDDCVFPPDWLRRYKAGFHAAPHVSLAGGFDTLVGKRSAFDVALDSVFTSPLGLGLFRATSRRAVVTGYPKLWNMALKRDDALEVSLPGKDGLPEIFDETLEVIHDVDLALRLTRHGKEFVRCPHSRVGHARDTNFRSFVARNFTMARENKRIGIHRAPHAVLGCSLVLGAALAAGAMFSPTLAGLFRLAITLYAFILLALGVTSSLRSGRIRGFFLAPVLLLGLHAARGLGFLLPDRRHQGAD